MVSKKTATKTSGDQPMVSALRIVSARDGFRRAHRAWSVAPTVVLLSELSEEDLADLKAEAMLSIEAIEIAAEAESDADTGDTE